MHNPVLSMQFDLINGPLIIKRWKLPTSTLIRWKREGRIPDFRTLGAPLDKVDIQTEEKLIQLVSTKWIKARTLGQLVGVGDRINAMMTSRRYPRDDRYHVHHLKSYEIKLIRLELENLQRVVGRLLYLASLTSITKNYSAVLQNDLRVVIRYKYLNTVNLRAGMDKRQVGRFWAFMRGQKAKCEDINVMLESLKMLYMMLNYS